jgi:hypothetical protein
MQVGGDEIASCLRDKHLAAVRGRTDTGGAVHVHAHVPLGRHLRLTGVDAHAHGQRERGLCLLRRGDRGGCRREGDEEGVALRIHLDAPVPLAGRAQDAAVLGQQVGVALAVLLQQPRRALDVGEEEGDGAGGELGQPQY